MCNDDARAAAITFRETVVLNSDEFRIFIVTSLVSGGGPLSDCSFSFMSQTLANHSYVDLCLVGNDLSGSDTVQT